LIHVPWMTLLSFPHCRLLLGLHTACWMCYGYHKIWYATMLLGRLKISLCHTCLLYVCQNGSLNILIKLNDYFSYAEISIRWHQTPHLDLFLSFLHLSTLRLARQYDIVSTALNQGWKRTLNSFSFTFDTMQNLWNCKAYLQTKAQFH
jgi:hypothetical protein